MSEIKKGKPPNNKGKRRSEKAILNAAESNRGKTRNKGKKHTRETLKKMSEARKGKSSWNKGISSSDETKKKQSESIKLWWKNKKGEL